MALSALKLDNSVWFDESYSAYLVRGSFSEIWNLTAIDVHPPLYYFLLKIWSSVFGYTDVAMRFMSVFFGALGIILLFFLLKKWFGTKVAGGASVMLALSPILVRYGQEMRMYTLVFFLVVAGTYALELLIETKKKRYYIIYAVILALGMWTHYFTALAWIAHIIYYKLVRKERVFEKEKILMYALAVAMFVPWIPFFFKQIGSVQSGFWIPEISIITPLEYLTQATIFSEAAFATGWCVVLLIGVVIFTIIVGRKVFVAAKKQERNGILSMLCLVLVPPVVLILLSLPPLTPMFIDRYTIYSAALIWAVLGTIIMLGLGGKLKWQAGILAILMLISAGFGIKNVTNRVPEGTMKTIVTEVQALSSEGEAIISQNEFVYYDAVMYSTAEHPVHAVNEWIDYRWGSLEPIRTIKYNLVEDFPEFLKENEKFWYIAEVSDEEIELPAEGYSVMSTVSTDDYFAVELMREK